MDSNDLKPCPFCGIEVSRGIAGGVDHPKLNRECPLWGENEMSGDWNLRTIKSGLEQRFPGLEQRVSELERKLNETERL